MPGTATAPHEPSLLRAAGPDGLPPSARALFGADLFSSIPWFDTVAQHAMPRGFRPVFVAIMDGDQAACVLPLRRHGPRIGPLSCPYTHLWQPLLAADAAGRTNRIAAGLAAAISSDGAPAFDAMPEGDGRLAAILHSVPGRRVLRYQHFGNWHLNVAGESWASYLAARPGALREAIRRRSRAIFASGGQVVLHHQPGLLESGIDAFEAVYRRSWKRREPYPGFTPALLRMLSAQGWLRLGVLRHGGVPIAAQYWAVLGGTAHLLKLAHDEAARRHSPGTVLTAAMLRGIIDEGGISEIDFGRGADAYKQAWTGSLRMRQGCVIADPSTLRGALSIARHRLGEWRHSRA